MRRTFLLAALIASLAAQSAAIADPALNGSTGLLNIPTAEALGEGTAAASGGHFAPKIGLKGSTYSIGVGFLRGFELTGTAFNSPGLVNDLSLGAKYAYSGLPFGASIAVGGQDIGGLAKHFRTKYAALTLPLGDLKATAGYGSGPDVLKGAFGGIEYRPWRFLGVLVDYDTVRTNAGLRFTSDPLWGGARIGATVAYRTRTDDVEYGAHVEFPLGRQEQHIAPAATSAPAATNAPGDTVAGGPSQAGPATAPESAPASRPSPDTSNLRDALTGLGFESVRVGTRGGDTLVVALENRRYNQSSADGIGLALGVIATRADPSIAQIELTQLTYGVPQSTVSVPATAYRAYLQDPAKGAELQPQLQMRPVDRAGDATVQWQNATAPLRATELVIEPVLRTFVATEYGLLDYGLGVRGRLTAPLGNGFLANLGLQAPVAKTDDFHEGRNFGPFAPKLGPDLATIQYLGKPAPQWNWLLSGGLLSVYQQRFAAVGMEQSWQSDDGMQLLRAKLLALHDKGHTNSIGLFGYQWFDPVRAYSVGATGGRFFAGDTGVRLDFNRYFGDTIFGLFFKAAGRHEQAVGAQISLPLTLRRDAYPDAVQLKGTRRFTHSLSSTINTSDGINHLRPLFLYEPTLDLDLRRDVLDSGRLGEAYLRDELPRMREAYELWGTSAP